MLAAAAGVYGAASSPAFELTGLDVQGVRYSDQAELRRRVEVTGGTNLFALATDGIEASLLELPTIQRATVSVRLPGTLSVEIVEREPILVWQVGDQRFLVVDVVQLPVDGAALAAFEDVDRGDVGAVPDDDRRDLVQHAGAVDAPAHDRQRR